MNATAVGVANVWQPQKQRKGFVCVVSCMIRGQQSSHQTSGRPCRAYGGLSPTFWVLARASYGLQSTTLEILAGSLVRYKDARSALEKLGAVGQDKGLKTQIWDQKRTT